MGEGCGPTIAPRTRTKRWVNAPQLRRTPRDWFVAGSALEEAGFELAVPPRRERLWGTTPGKHRRLGPGPVRGSAFRIAVSNWQRPEEPFAGAGPVRIRFPPAESHVQNSSAPAPSNASGRRGRPTELTGDRGTDGSNPSPSSGGSGANLTSS